MISLLAANDSAAAVAALGSLPVAAAAQIGGSFYIGSPGQHLPLPPTGFGTDRAAAAALNSVIRAPGGHYGDFVSHQSGGQRTSFCSQGLIERDSVSGGDEEDSCRTKFKTASIDEMDDDESYLSIPGDEKFAAFRQMAISGKMANKICRVCGDRALGYNFNVVSCESCKAFFRRNALKKKEFRCPFNDNCDVTALSRRFCQKCRLRKCFEVGMKKEWIMSEEQRLQKRKRIEENRQKRRALADKGKVVDDGDDDEEPSTEDTPSQKATRSDQQQNLTNAGFSPGSNPSTPVVSSLGNDFSPPDSNGPSQTDVKRSLDGQTFLSPSTIISTPRPLLSENRLARSTSEVFNASSPAGHHLGEAMKKEHPLLSSCMDTKKRSPVVTIDHSSILFSNSPHQMFNTLDMKLNFGTSSSERYSEFPLAGSNVQQDGLAADDSSITIPKAVLINLINQCHQKQREYFDMANTEAPPPPIVVRAHRLYVDDGMSSEHELYKCICRCTCGAKTSGSCIGPKLVDRGVGPEDDECLETDDKVEEVRGRSPAVSVRETSLMPLPSNMEIMEAVRSPIVDSFDPYGLTILEELKLRELLIANQVMIEDPDSSDPNAHNTSSTTGSSSADDPIIGQDNGGPASQIDPNDVIHMTDVCVRRIIKMCKRLSAFKSLCQDDQIALLKGGCTELMILRGVMTFIPSKECWRPVGWKNSLLSLDVMKSVKGNVYEEHKKYLHSFREEWRTCDAIMLTLAAITLFNPERPNILHVDAVQMEQELYISLLKRYLDIMYGVGTMASEEAFQELLNRVTAVGRLNDYAATIFLDVNPRDVEPLLIEIFDLK